MSYAMFPEHVAAGIPPQTLANMTYTAYDGKNVRPLDAVVRIDIAGPLGDHDIRMWEDTVEVNYTERVKFESIQDDSYGTL